MNRTDHIKEMINRYQSSFYFYDLDQFEAHIKSIKKTLHPDIRVWYATKANPLSEILRILNKNGFGADVASLGELQQARSAGYGPHDLIATGPAKSKNYLAAMMQAEVQAIVVESLNQLKDLNDVAGKLGRTQEVLLRVQLDWNDDLKSVLGGSTITPFGLGVEDWQTIQLSDYKNIQVMGLHCFQWGNMLDLAHLEKVWTHTTEACQKLSLAMGFPLQVLDLGGGLGLSYSDNREMNFSEVHELLLKLKKKYELDKIWLELGRFSIGKFGSYLTRIVDIKTVRGKNIIVTEGGINHMARPALVGEAFPCEAFMVEGTTHKRYAVHGPLCTALDSLGEFDLPESLKVGDWLEFKRTGAYGFSESMPHFLCHNLVGEAIVHHNELMVPRVPKTNLEWMV
ncbi:MAG: alanine racemase [Bacteriovoracaceae bacterium]|nr:alanine racemase [Bacteriovoracaceae bacterium]